MCNTVISVLKGWTLVFHQTKHVRRFVSFRYQREKSRNSSEIQEAERLLRQYGEMESELHSPDAIRGREDVQKLSRRHSQESYTLTDVDKLLDDIPDGSAIDDLQGLQSLINEDSELEELLADVFSGTNSSVSRIKFLLVK